MRFLPLERMLLNLLWALGMRRLRLLPLRAILQVRPLGLLIVLRLTLLSLCWGLSGGVLATRGGWAGVVAAFLLIVAGGGMYRAGELSAEILSAERAVAQNAGHPQPEGVR